MKARAVLASSLSLILGMAFLLTACGPGGGSGASMMAAVPDGDYQAVFSFKPNEFIKSGFITKLKENFPMAEMMFAELESGPEQSGMKLEEIDTIMAFTATDGENIMMISGSFDPTKARAEFEKNQGVTLTEKKEGATTYWHDADSDAGLLFNGNVGFQATEAGLKKVIGTMAGSGKKYVDGDSYKKVGHLMNSGATISFAAGNTGEFDPSMMAMQLGQMEEDQEKVEMLTAAMGKMTGTAGSFTIKDSVDGRISMVFSEAAAAKNVADYMNGKKDYIFEQMADQAQEMAAMMPNFNVDRDKIKALARTLSFAAEGDVMHVNIHVAWDDIAFLFANK